LKKFQKTKENFICQNCGENVKGDGYTNHCPSCLWSKHVDINPGDRTLNCGCLMEPISYEKSGEEISIIHKCTKCGCQKKNKISKEDNLNELISL